MGGKGITKIISIRQRKDTDMKDLLNVGIFTAVYFVLNLLVAAVLGMIPAVYMLVPFVSSFLLGIPMMLYFMKIKKFGMVLITYIVYGVLLTLAGVGIYSLILGIVFALIAELILRSGKYQKINRAIFAFALASVGANGNIVCMVLAGADYFERKAATYGSEYMQLMQSYFEAWWVLPVLMLSAFLGGLLGGFLGKAVFKKHFVRSGVI